MMDLEEKMWDNKEFRVRLEENSMRDYERIMLTSGECGFFMPMGFIGEEGGEVACYDCSGFAPLNSYSIEKTDDALYILESVLLIVGKSIEYLITPAKITVTEDTVFYNKETGQVKIAYIPITSETVSMRNNLAAFVDQLSANIRDGKDHYLTEAKKYIMHHNYYIREMVNKVGLFKRQLYTEYKQEKS